MKKFLKLFIIPIIISTAIMTGCGTINVSGKTFGYDSVSIDWGLATDNEKKQLVFDEFQVKSESELLGVLKTRNNRDKRMTAFGTNGEYVTKDDQGEILDQGFYKQNESVITLAETEEGLSADGTYTLQANDKGYIVTIKINDEYKVFAKYQYVSKS